MDHVVRFQYAVSSFWWLPLLFVPVEELVDFGDLAGFSFRVLRSFVDLAGFSFRRWPTCSFSLQCRGASVLSAYKLTLIGWMYFCDPGIDLREFLVCRRIKEVKAEERRKAVEEIIYALIVQKFVDADVTLVPKIPALSDNDTRQVDISPAQEIELEAVHSLEALEMVREHLAVVLGGRGTSSFLDQHTIAHISKLRVGQVYAASIMYGYFLRRVDQRFQLEKNMKSLLGSGQMLDAETSFQITEDDRPIQSETDSLAAEAAAAIANLAASEAAREKLSNGSAGFAQGMKSSKLRSYVMAFDPETLQQCATMRAKESLNVIEKHAEALFGKPEIRIAPDGTFKVVSDDTIRVSFSGLRRLVLEAVAFGTFLWDVETSVDSQYSLIGQ
jgi:hypothetical protein